MIEQEKLQQMETQACALARKAFTEWQRTGAEPTIRATGLDAFADSLRARAEDLYWDLRMQQREREDDERAYASKR